MIMKLMKLVFVVVVAMPTTVEKQQGGDVTFNTNLYLQASVPLPRLH
jgi:hypothetical protein